MAKIIGLPKLSPTMDEGVLVRWTKNEGDAIEIDDLLAEVETDKATMEFRSFDKGVLLKKLASEGASLKPDAPVAVIGQAGEDISKLDLKASSGASPVVAQATPEAAKASSAAPAAVPSEGGRVLASPVVRKIARENDIDLSAVAGTGPGGRVIKKDVDGLATGVSVKAPTALPRSVVSQEARVVPLSSMRKTIARRLTESKQNVPHFYLTVDVDAGPLSDARAFLVKQLEATKEKVSLNDMIIKACAVALRRVPEVNAAFMGDSIHYHNRVDISVAVAIPDGLVTPVIRNADQLGVLEISRAVKELAGKAKDKKLKPEEMMNGTFSVSNLGMFGIDSFSAVINPPEGAILAVGTVRNEPVVKGGVVVPGQRMHLTLSCDHRVIDGAVGAKWLQTLQGLIENPVSMLL